MFTIGIRVVDWRSASSWPDLRAGDIPARRHADFVLLLACVTCGHRWLGEAPMVLPQPCPACGGVLERLAAWDLRSEGRPP